MSKMEGWKSERLGDLFETGSGTTPLSTNAIYYEGNINWLLTGDLNDGIIRDTSKKISDKALKDYSTLKMYPKRSVVIALYGATIGKLGFLEIESTTNQACCVLFNSQSMQQDYLFYNLLFSKNRILALAVGGGQPNISQNIIKNFIVSFPTSLTEQKKIASILSTIDSSITQTEQLIAKYKNIKQGLMHDLLTYGIDQNGTIRDPHTHSFVEKNGMMVPEEWEAKRIDEISEVNPNREKEIPSIVSFVAMGDVSENAKLMSPKLTELRLVKNGFTPFKRGDILVAKITPCFENGKGAFLNELYTEYGFGSTEFHVLRSKINAYFLYSHTTSIPFRNKLSSQMTGSAGQQRVSTDAIRTYKIGIPSKIEQQKIAEILETQDNLIESEQTNLAKLQKLKQGLMQDLLTGKVRVNCNH